MVVDFGSVSLADALMLCLWRLDGGGRIGAVGVVVVGFCKEIHECDIERFLEEWESERA
jgi:hypothetical protein